MPRPGLYLKWSSPSEAQRTAAAFMDPVFDILVLVVGEPG